MKKNISGSNKTSGASNRIFSYHLKKHTLRVIAEKISCFEMDEWLSLNLVVETLYCKGVRWTINQIRTAVKHCFDPRYYTRHDIKDLYEKAGFVVSTDTGPAHIAAAIGTPVVALFGPTAPWRTGPFGEGHRIIRANLACSPCFKRQCQTKACMEQISVEDVMEGIEKLKEKGNIKR